MLPITRYTFLFTSKFSGMFLLTARGQLNLKFEYAATCGLLNMALPTVTHVQRSGSPGDMALEGNSFDVV